jgi:hypothetical protein
MDTVRIRVTDLLTNDQRFRTVVNTSQVNTFQLRGLRPNTTYSIEFRGKCNGRAGLWSSPTTFTTLNGTARITDDNPLGLHAFPNPTSDFLTLTFESEDESDYIVKVCDMTGRELVQQVRTAYTGTTATEIPVNNFAKGAYLLIVQKGTLRSQFRFTVQ